MRDCANHKEFLFHQQTGLLHSVQSAGQTAYRLYGMTACPPESSADSKLLERVQAKATALVHGLRGLNLEERKEGSQSLKGGQLVKEMAANGRRQRKNLSRVIHKWNLLLTEVKTAPSLDSFKNRLDETIFEGN